MTKQAKTAAKKPAAPAFALHYVSPGLYRSQPEALKNGRSYEMARTEDGQWSLSRTLKTGKVEQLGKHRTNYDAIRKAKELEDIAFELPAKLVAKMALKEKLAAQAAAAAEPAIPPAEAIAQAVPAGEAQVEL